MSRLRIASCTDPGARGGNEDDHRHGSGAAGHYAVLADGAGGHSRGEEASYRAVESIARALAAGDAEFSPEYLTRVVRDAHADLLREQQGQRRPEQRMHTTVVALWVHPSLEQVLWTHVGDSRLYRVRHGQGELLTQDDSIVQHMVRSGMLSEEQGRAHPQKNHLLAALGIDGEITPHTVVRPVEVMEGDAFLLTSDGWWDSFEPSDIAAALHRSDSPEQWLDDMRRQIAARAVPRQDNYTAVAVWVGDPGDMTIARFEDTVPRGLR
ncbi:MAG: serine/threonine-protein phosphatase [Betaproteobacteria bacterium]|nr:serine/threonine-protein phosphatase [Betaproteobacteria bacterium]